MSSLVVASALVALAAPIAGPAGHNHHAVLEQALDGFLRVGDYLFHWGLPRRRGSAAVQTAEKR